MPQDSLKIRKYILPYLFQLKAKAGICSHSMLMINESKDTLEICYYRFPIGPTGRFKKNDQQEGLRKMPKNSVG